MSAPAPLPRLPVVLREGRWWLVGSFGSMPASDPAFTAVLDDFAQALAAADRAVDALPTRPSTSSVPDAGGQR